MSRNRFILMLVAALALAGCGDPEPPRGADALAALEHESGARWRAVFDPTLTTATFVGRVPDAPGEVAPAPTAGAAAPADAARAFVTRHATLFGAAAADGALALVELAPDPLGGARARFELRIAGLPVDGGDVVAVVDDAGRPRAVSGRLPRELGLAASPALSGDEASARALGAVGAKAPALQLALEAPPELVALVVGASARPAWRVTVTGEGVADPTQLLRRIVLVDAATGEILREREGLFGERARGSGIGTGGERRPLEIYRTSAGDYVLRDETHGGAVIRTYTAGGGEKLPGRLVRSPVPTAWDEGVPGAGAAVDAHAFAAVTLEYLATVHGRAALDGRDGDVRVVVHFGDALENAFWDGRRAVFGDGGWDVGPLAGGLDVVAHELFHAVTQRDSGLVYEGESGALNESLSDVFAVFVELYAGGGDWTIGEAIADPPLRDLEDPSRVGLPSHMDEYVDWPLDPEHDMGGVHVNSSIPSHAAWLLAKGGTHRLSRVKVTGIGVAKTRRIWYRAASLYLGPWAGFEDFAAATITAAEDLYGADSAAARSVASAWRAVGVESR